MSFSPDDAWADLQNILTDLKKNADIDDNHEVRDDPKDKECSHEEIIVCDSNYVCATCNTVLSRFIDQTAEWRFYGVNDNKAADPTRCGMPTNELLPGSSLGSMIGYTNKDNYDFRMMRKYHMWNSMSYKERTLYNIFENLTIIAINSGIPKSILEEAKLLYKQVSESRITRGDNRHGLIASSIYIACKKNGVPRSSKEIAKIFNINSTTMTKGCKKFQEIMKINIKTSMSSDFINRFCSNVNLSKEQTDICKSVVNIIEEGNLVSENTPPSIASGVIFLCSEYYNWGIPKKIISKACDVSQVTITKCFTKLSLHTDAVFKNIERE